MTMRMQLTDRDKEILRHVEEFDSVTIKQVEKMWTTNAYGYDVARKRLNKMVRHERLKVSKEYITGENVYYMPSGRKLSYHGILLMNYYAELIHSGAKIQLFEREKEWLDGKIRSDAFAVYDFKQANKIVRYFNIVEVNLTNRSDLNKYKELYVSHILQNQYDCFPRIIVIDDIERRKHPDIGEDVEVIQLDFQLSGFPKIFLEL